MLGILGYKAWAIEPVYAARMAPILFRAITNGNFNEFVVKNREAALAQIQSFYSGQEVEKVVESYDSPLYYSATAKNGIKVAIVPMMGAITKNGDACSWGWRDYQNTIARIEKNPNIGALIIHFNNTPGGTIDGTPEVASLMKKFSKPTLAFGDGYVASAHYYVASQMNHIMSNKLNPTEFGSIGSLILWQNIQNMIEKGELPTMEIIRAPQSTDKAKLNALEPLTDELRADLKDDLKSVTREFINTVKKGRGEKLTEDEDLFTGNMYSHKESIAYGLADSEGSLQDAIEKAASLVAVKKSQRTSAHQGTSNTQMKFPKLSSLFSGEAWGKALSAFTDDEAPLEAAEQKVATMEADLAKANGEKSAAETRATAAEAKVTELTTQVNTLGEEKKTLEAKVAELEKKTPTGHATTVITGTKEEKPAADQGGEQEGKYLTSVDREMAELNEKKSKLSTYK